MLSEELIFVIFLARQVYLKSLPEPESSPFLGGRQGSVHRKQKSDGNIHNDS